MAYYCPSASRLGLFSNPNETHLGVPQGVDTSPDPLKAAWNARTLNESAAYIAGFRASAATTAPAAPSALTALASAHDAIDVAWSDNSSNETTFEVQRSPDGSAWATIAILGANSVGYGDNGLQPETTYHYRVRAQNGAGNSSFSNTVFTATQALPDSIDASAQSDVFTTGTVAGSYVATMNADGSIETITEQHAGGPKRSRKQSYEHGWTFDVAGGAGGVVASVDAWVSGNEGANFYYSVDAGANWTMMFTVANTSSGTPQMFALPGGTSGPIMIEVRDATQTNGETIDSVSVDHVVLTSYMDAGSPPLAPSDMNVTSPTSSTVTMYFTDNAESEHGFDVHRSGSDPAGDCTASQSVETIGANAGMGVVDYVDTTAAPSTTYWYWATAFNGAGDDGSCSNAASAQTAVAPQITLSVNGYKVKGRQQADLTWSGATGTDVDVVRNGSLVATTTNDGAYTDVIGSRGGGSYTYQLCEAGSNTCSPPAVVTF